MLLSGLQKRPGVQCLWVLLALLTLGQTAYIGMSVSASSLEINQVASYSFTLNRQFDPVNSQFIMSPAAVPLNSLIKIVFPVQFQTISSSSSVACVGSSGSDLGCSLNAATRTVTVNNYYSSSSSVSDSNIVITMPSIVNAYKSGTTDNFYWSITQADGTLIDQGPAVNTNFLNTALTFTGGIFTCTSLVTQPAPSRPPTPTSRPRPLSPSASSPRTPSLLTLS